MNMEYRPEGLLHFTADRPCTGSVGLEIGSCAPEHPKSRELLAYWQARKSPDGFVHRPAIEPWEIVRLLPNLLIAEPAAGGWSYRLFGTGLVQRLRLDFTGKSLPYIFDPATAGVVDHLYWTVATQNRPVAVRGRFLGLGIEHATGEGLHMPILARDNRTVQVLGGVFFLD